MIHVQRKKRIIGSQHNQLNCRIRQYRIISINQTRLLVVYYLSPLNATDIFDVSLHESRYGLIADAIELWEKLLRSHGFYRIDFVIFNRHAANPEKSKTHVSKPSEFSHHGTRGG